MFVHGSPRNPLHEYLFPEDIYLRPKLDRNFALMEATCFCGHTHVPGVFTEGDPYEFQPPEELNDVYALDHRKAIVNVGSVGQPRDGDRRACYVLFDGATVRFQRVDYDIDATVRRIYDNGDLENFLGDRLRDGS